LSGILYSETAVIPYRIENPSKSLTLQSGKDYSRLIIISAMIKKNITISRPSEINRDLKRIGIDPQGIITEEDLVHIGETRLIDYIITGSISKAHNRYISESIIYAVNDKRIIQRIRVSASSLITLAQKESKQLHAIFRNKKSKKRIQKIDCAFLIDSSFNIRNDLKKIKDSVLQFASDAIDKYGIDTRIHLLPFSGKINIHQNRVSMNSLIPVKNQLAKFIPSGKTQPQDLEKALRYSLINLKWRENSGKLIFILTNTNLNSRSFAEKYAFLCKSKKIRINSISLGNLRSADSELINRLSDISGGIHMNVSYHQKLLDINGNRIDTYIERKRLFTSGAYDKAWKEGLLESDRYQPEYGKPKHFLDELFYNEKKYPLTPYNITSIFPQITGKNIINSEKLENNISDIFMIMSDIFYKNQLPVIKPSGKVLLSDNNISIWVTPGSSKDLDFFISRKKTMQEFPVAIEVRKAPENKYGLTINPVLTGLDHDTVPDILKTDLKKIIEKKDYYMTNGFLYPPVWFINVKVEKIKKYRKKIDIRE